MSKRKIIPRTDTKCVECGEKVRSSDEYEWSQRSRAMGGGMIFIHTECYQKLLKPKTNNKI